MMLALPGLVASLAIFVVAAAVGRLFARTGHGLAWRLAPWAPVAGLGALFAGAFFGVALPNALAGAFVAAALVWWFALLGVLALKRWPADIYGKTLAGKFE